MVDAPGPAPQDSRQITDPHQAAAAVAQLRLVRRGIVAAIVLMAAIAGAVIAAFDVPAWLVLAAFAGVALGDLIALRVIRSQTEKRLEAYRDPASGRIEVPTHALESIQATGGESGHGPGRA